LVRPFGRSFVLYVPISLRKLVTSQLLREEEEEEENWLRRKLITSQILCA
jgi:hypothetical protein